MADKAAAAESKGISPVEPDNAGDGVEQTSGIFVLLPSGSVEGDADSAETRQEKGLDSAETGGDGAGIRPKRGRMPARRVNPT